MVAGSPPVFDSVEDVYLSDGAVHRERYANLRNKYQERFGSEPFFFSRAPGRVNVIGEHVDYSGYSVLPMAIEGDAVIAVGQANQSKQPGAPAVVLCNVDPSFPERECTMYISHITTDTSVFQHHHWTNYFLAASQGLIRYSKDESIHEDIQSLLQQLVERFGTIQMMIHGTVPVGSGLSSSSSMVCSYTLTLAHLLSYQKLIPDSLATKNQLASICAKSERFIGIESGGMDQAISFLAEKEFAMRIDFYPSLKATKVQLPKCASFVLCNSMVEHKLQTAASGIGYNVRVVECRLAAAVLSYHLQLPNKSAIKTLGEFEQQAAGVDAFYNATDRLDYCLKVVDECLHKEPYNVKELKAILGEEEFPERYLGSVHSEEILNSLKLYQRAKHVFSEAKRVLMFQEYCEYSNIESEADLKKLGDLMNLSHTSCRVDYDCSCKELDDVVEHCIQAGAVSARLTGAGWGGWCIAMVHGDQLESFLAKLRPLYSAQSYFVTKPAVGACAVKNQT
mmetsp:Transcript_24647/g.31356  ORF Transcript_24647/g.31356 Transcript_24647/m.31356 type:complete len:508 (-) Transcript_24647:19-1542(-)